MQRLYAAASDNTVAGCARYAGVSESVVTLLVKEFTSHGRQLSSVSNYLSTMYIMKIFPMRLILDRIINQRNSIK